ncbi:MAG: PP2C family protein-serine/threonine phosphatase [Phycisphaerae bacterium]
MCPLPNLPENLKPFLERNDVQCDWITSYALAEKNDFLDHSELALFCPGKLSDIAQKRNLGKFLLLAQQKKIPILLLTEDRTLANLIPVDNTHILPRVQTASPEIGTEELWGRICAMLDFSPWFNRIEQYTGQLEKWACSLNNRFEELHQELRLAWRVQQDFLPKRMPKTSKLRFGALYRPASWVSGDIYDIFQLDEHHIGFFIADVVGHGVAAGLMTLFVKRALVTKEISGRSYRLLTPDQAMARLNDDLASLELPEHQFVTACYGIINTQTLELTIARAGHPLPILITSDGRSERIELDGSLLGVFSGAEFPGKQMILPHKTKLILVTDGLEQAFGNETGEEKMIEKISNSANLPAQQMIDALAAIIDCQENSLHPADDITAVVIETL